MATAPIEPSVVDHRTEISPEHLRADPTILAGTTTSLGSYCLRWQLALSGESRKVAVNRRQLPVR